MSPEEYCATRAAPQGSSLSFAIRVLPRERRVAALAVHAFCREVGDVLREVADPGVARLKLGWWRIELAAAFDGRPQHPVSQVLAPCVRAFSLPREPFDTLVDGVAADFERPLYPDFAALEEHCRRIAGSAWLLTAEICGYSNAATRHYATELGIALQLTSIIRTLGADVRRARLYVPRDDLDRFGVDPRELLRPPTPTALFALVAHQVNRARSRYATAAAALPRADRRAQRPGIIVAALGNALLAEIERDGFRVLDRRLSLSPALKAWIAWKASWVW